MKTTKELFELLSEAKFKTYMKNIRVKGSHHIERDHEYHASEIKRIKNAMEMYPSHDAQVKDRQEQEIKKHQVAMHKILSNASDK
jgi:hypothetical protein